MLYPELVYRRRFLPFSGRYTWTCFVSMGLPSTPECSHWGDDGTIVFGGPRGKLRIERLVHDAHAATTELFANLVMGKGLAFHNAPTGWGVAEKSILGNPAL